jgi:phage terminase large subunit GpA-like protein
MLGDRFGLGSPGPVVDPFERGAAELRRFLDDLGASSADVALRRTPFRSWAESVPEARGPLDFGRFRFQAELYDERSAHDAEMVVMKATQIGASSMTVRWVLYHADVHGRVALYTFPTDRELADFSRQRIRPLIRRSEHLMSRIPPDGVDNVGQRQVGVGWVYMRGTTRPIDSIDADVVVFDEYDSSDQANLEASERRVTGPMSAGLLRRVGVPSIPGFGISKAYEETDQRIWTIRCDACSAWNPMRGADAFAANVDQEQLVLVCRKCRRRLDIRLGQWVATFPDREVRGYHLPRLIVPGTRLSTIVANSRKTRPDQRQAFFNRDLGEPYAPSDGRLSIERIRACVDPDLRPLARLASHKFVVMGVNVASARALNVVIEEALDDRTGRRVFVGEVEDRDGRTAFDQLCELMDRYGVTMACIDHAPEGRFASAFA